MATLPLARSIVYLGKMIGGKTQNTLQDLAERLIGERRKWIYICLGPFRSGNHQKTH